MCLPTDRFRRRLMLIGSVGLILLVVGSFARERYRIGVGLQTEACLPPYRIFLVDKSLRPGRNDLIAFAADGRLLPYFPPGTLLIKAVRGLGGDQVSVAGDAVRVNGAIVASATPSLGMTPLAAALHRSPADFQRVETIPPGHYWVMGATPNSFDSRYWGTVDEAQVVGRAYPLW